MVGRPQRLLRRRRRSQAQAVIALGLAVTISACTPTIRDFTPAEARRLRAGLERVGVRADGDPVDLTFRQPAKGVLGGAERGAVVGAMAPIAVGAVIPLPGTTFLALFVAPFTAFGGMIYGAIAAHPRAEVNEAEAAIGRALAAAQETHPHLRLRDLIVARGNAVSGRSFVALEGEQTEGVDAVVELSDRRAGLEGAYRVDPPSLAFAETRARLRNAAGETLLDETVTCSGEERTYFDWAASDGSLFADAMESCIPALAAKIIDDFFLLYPLPDRRVETKD